MTLNPITFRLIVASHTSAFLIWDESGIKVNIRRILAVKGEQLITAGRDNCDHW